jgi:ubiquinone/menaquinone biosynthesis C-methylase UbiE
MNKRKMNSNNKKKKQEIIHKYNQTSDFYDGRYLTIQQDKFRLILKDIIFNDKLILDAGCGTGLLFEYIEGLFEKSDIPSIHYVGVDISINMLKKFHSKCNQKVIKFNLILSDLENLPFRENKFTLLFSFTSLQNLPDIIQGLKESFRVVIEGANVNFSILRKKLDKEILKGIFTPQIKDMKIIDLESVEDILFRGKASKE